MSPRLTVGLTGGLASGKSTAAHLFERRGARVLDADRVVAGLYEAGCDGTLAVVELFGTNVLQADGAVDRRRLANIVFDDARALEELNAAIHPLVRRAVAAWLEGLDTDAIAVIEATLMIESGSYRDYDRLVLVWCEAGQQVQRAVARGLTHERATKVIAAQKNLDEKRAFADFVIDNSMDPEHLEHEVDRVWHRLLEACPER